jgi:hypothetical protein
VAELFEGHRAASISFGKLSRNIAVELSLPPEERSMSGLDMVSTCRTELDRLLEQSPTIPLQLVQQFGLKFKDSTFRKPDILEIKEVSIFRKEVDEELEKKKEEARAAAAVERKVHKAALEMRALKKERRQSINHVGKRMDRLLSSIQVLGERHMEPATIVENISTSSSSDDGSPVVSIDITPPPPPEYDPLPGIGDDDDDGDADEDE